MEDKTDILEIKDQFKKIENISSIPVFENRLTESPRFTIAIPTYKRASTLKETIDSALAQDIDESYEIIVADNNPKRGDETEILMAEYASIPGLSYFKHAQNLGMNGNWNRMVELTRSKYFVLLHDDDCIAPFFLRAGSQILAKHPDASLLQFTKTNEKKFTDDASLYKARRVHLLEQVPVNFIGAPTGVIYLKETISQLGGWDKDEFPSLDYFFDTRLIANNKIAYKSQLKATFYRIGINLSLKKEIMASFVIQDAKLREATMKKLHFPRFLRNWYTEARSEDDMNCYSLSEVDITPVIVNRYSKFNKFLSLKFIHGLIKIIHIVYGKI